MFPVVGQSRKRLHDDFRRRGLRDRYDFRLAASGEFGVSGELDPVGVAVTLDQNGRAQVSGDGAAFLVRLRMRPGLRRGQATDIPAIDIEGAAGEKYQLRVEAGVVKSTASGTYGSQ